MENLFYTFSLSNYLTLLSNDPGWAETCIRLITGNYGVIPETSLFVCFMFVIKSSRNSRLMLLSTRNVRACY